MNAEYGEQECRVPKWNVVNSKGKIVGEVYGYNENDAIRSVQESPCYDYLYQFQVIASGSPLTWNGK